MKTARESAATDVESLVAEVAERFTDDVKQGRSPSIEEYAQHHPEIAHIIRQVFPALAMLDVSSTTWLPDRKDDGHNGGVLGDFRLIREIGRGGMGVVFEAEQISPGRTVALKMLPYAGVLGDQHLQRFKNEARAAATLEHPHIVPVYSIGCERGVHYFTMRYIEGQSLAEVLQAIPAYRARVLEASSSPSALASQLANLLATSPQSTALPSAGPESNPPLDKLDTQRVIQAGITTDGAIDNPALIQNVARLGIQAAEALAYAHERGILHRDIKPSNLLLDVHGDLWVADFGLARLEQDAGITVTGDMLGTLRYMSPEQALGQRAVLDERADVYSLGVTLYEMLALRPAFSGHDRQEILRRIATEEPTPPRQIDPRIPRDLETIVQKAICKEAAGRYQTAGQLADDLRRYLDHKPIQARRPTRTEKLVKWSRRHPSVVWATAVVLLTTTIMAAVSTWQAIRATRAEQQAKASEQFALKNSRRADAISDFLINALRSPDPARDGRSVTIAEVLDRTAKEVEEEFADDQRMQADLLNAIAQSYQGLGLYRESVDLFAKVQELRSTSLGRLDPGTIESMSGLAQSFERAGQLDKAMSLNEEILKIQQAHLAPDDPELLATTTKLAWDYNHAGQTEKVLALFQEVLRLVQAKVKSNVSVPVELPDSPESVEDGEHPKKTVKPLIEDTFEHLDDTGANRKNVLVALNNLAKAFAEAGQVDQAIPLYQQTLQLMQEKLGPDNPTTLSCMYNLAMAFKVARRFDEAIPMFDETLRLRKQKFGPESEIVARTLTCAGATYGAAGNKEKQAELFGESLRITKARLTEDHPDTIWAMWQYGASLCDVGREQEALAIWEKALPLCRVNPGVDHPTTRGLMRDLLEIYRANGRYEEAIPLLEETLKLRQFKLGPDHPATLWSMNDLAYADLYVGRSDETVRLVEEALARLKAAPSLDRHETVRIMGQLAATYYFAGRLNDCLSLRQDQFQISKAELGPNDPDTLQAMCYLAMTYLNSGQYDESIRLLEEAVKLTKATLGLKHPDTENSMRQLGIAYCVVGRLDEAVQLDEEALRLQTANLGPNHPVTISLMFRLAYVLRMENRYAEAETLNREALSKARANLKSSDTKITACIDELVRTLLEEGKFVEAEPLARESLEIWEKRKLQPNDWREFTSRGVLGGALLGQRRYTAAEPLLISAYEGLRDGEATLPANQKRFLAQALERLVQLYEAIGQPEKAAAFNAELSAYNGKIEPKKSEPSATNYPQFATPIQSP